MKLKPSLLTLAQLPAMVLMTGLLATGALADADQDKVEKKHHVAVFINKSDDANDADIKLKINGETWKFQLPTLSEGEERFIATEDGRTVKTKRTGNEVTIEAGGETVKIPAAGPRLHARFHGVPAVPAVPSAGSPLPAPLPFNPEELKTLRNSVIISGAQLTEEQQQKVKAALKSAGIDKPVKFVQHSQHMVLQGKGPMVWQTDGDGNGDRQVIVITTDSDDREVVTEAIDAVEKTDKGTR